MSPDINVACLWLTKPAPTEKLAELCLRFSPQIAVRKNEAVFVEIGKMRLLYNTEEFVQIFQKLLNPWLKKIEISTRLGLGREITDALSRARYGADIENLGLSVLNDFADPFNTDAIVQHYIARMNKAFADLGIRNIRQFRKIPANELVSRFGPVSLLCRQRLDFSAPITWPYWKPQEMIKEKTDFPYFEFYGELEPILFELKKQLDQIFQRLWARELRAQKMRLRIFCETNSRNTRPYREFNFDFLLPQSQTKGALNIIKERLAKDFEQAPVITPIQGIEVSIIESVPGISGQKNLLHRHEETAEAKHALLAQLTEMHGEGRIFHASLVEDRRPEKSWQKCAHLKKNISLQMNIPLRPTHLVAAQRVQINHNNIILYGQNCKILNRSYIERINGAWFEDVHNLNDGYSRDYYNMELEDGRKVSVYQTKDGNFYLQGFFA